MEGSDSEVLILQHVENEHAGTLLDFMKARQMRFHAVRLHAGEALPEDTRNLRAALIMGGPMNVYEEDAHPFLKQEDVFIKELLAQGVPLLGICLGAQLVAKALAACVVKVALPEIGWSDLTLSPESKTDPLFLRLKTDRLHVLQWHEDTFELQRGAAPLASSAVARNQAFRFGDVVYGFQFHVEVDEPMLKDWFKKAPDRTRILEEYENYRPTLARITESLYDAFFRLTKTA